MNIALADDLFAIGITSKYDLRGTDPIILFDKIRMFSNRKYTKRTLINLHIAIHFATTGEEEPEKLTPEYWRKKLTKFRI